MFDNLKNHMFWISVKIAALRRGIVTSSLREVEMVGLLVANLLSVRCQSCQFTFRLCVVGRLYAVSMAFP